VLLAGAGVGGHCLPKDPWLLLANVFDYTPRLIPAARAVNGDMPAHVVELTRRGLERHGVVLEKAHLAVLGFSYLPNSDDTRNSPSAAVVSLLRGIGADVRIHDPLVPAYQGSLEEVVTGADALLLLVAHDAYRDLDLAHLRRLVRTPLIVDARNVFPAQMAHAAGFDRVSVGVGSTGSRSD
jgi:UDP-N-acetyl-D-mannosaminuronic acid dehydrogenase